METETRTKEAPTDTCYRLIYRSHSLLPDSGRDEAAPAVIPKQARSNNAYQGVTGALLPYDHWLAQVLEGPQAAVEALYA